MAQIYIKALLIVIALFAFMIPGYVLKKLKMFAENANAALSNLLLYVCQPALIMNAFCVFSQEDWEVIQSISKLTMLANFGIVASISLIAILALFGLCKLIFIKSKNKSTAGIYTFVTIFSNCGFLGVPFVILFTDNNPIATMYMMVFNVVFNVLCWTLGVLLISGDPKEIRLKKIICNPTIITTVIGLIFFFVPKINFFMFDALKEWQIIPKYLSNMTAPLSMIIVGSSVADMKFKEIFRLKGIYLTCALRLIVAPLLTFAVAISFYGIFRASNAAVNISEEYLFLAPVVAMAMTPASLIVAFAERFHGDRDTATAAFVSNTLFGIIIMPIMVVLITTLWGLL